MIEIPLTRGYVAVVDDTDAHLADFKWHAEVKANTVYAVRRIPSDGAGPRQGRLYLHQAVLGVAGHVKVDHRDHDGLNCRRGNLRTATDGQNAANRKPGSANTSGFKGVTRHRRAGKWQAQIEHDGQCIYLGLFDEPEAAALAYDAAARKFHRDFAFLNFPESAGATR